MATTRENSPPGMLLPGMPSPETPLPETPFLGNVFIVTRHEPREQDASGDLLARFLRERRARITLAEAGLPARRGSRTGTLTQEDLAHLTGYSVRTVSALEHGSRHRATPDLLEALAAALRLSPDERHTLWYLAAKVPPPALAQPAGGLDSGLARLVEVTDPHPAFAAGSARNVLAQNQACAEWGTDPLAMPEGQRNATYWVFLNPHARHVFVHWETQAARVSLGIMRSQLVRWPHDKQLKAVIEELRALSPVARRLWETTDAVALSPGPTVTMRVPGHTDPAQADDEKYHVKAAAIRVNPAIPDITCSMTAFLLPRQYARRYPVPSQDACTACAREAAVLPRSAPTSTS